MRDWRVGFSTSVTASERFSFSSQASERLPPSALRFLKERHDFQKMQMAVMTRMTVMMVPNTTPMTSGMLLVTKGVINFMNSAAVWWRVCDN